MNPSTVLATKYQSLATPFFSEFHSDHVGAVNCLAVEQQYCRFLLSAGADSSIAIWDLENTSQSRFKPQSFKKVAEIPRKSKHQYGVSSVQWYPGDAGLFVTSSFDHYVKVWDSENLSAVYDFDLKYRVYCADMSLTGEHALVATATDHPLIRLLDLRTTSTTHTLKGHMAGSVQSVKWSPTDAHTLASGGSDGTIRLWDIRQSRSCVDVLDMHRTKPDNERGENPNVARGGLGFGFNAKVVSHMGTVNGLLWLRNGRALISAGTDDAVRLWKLPRYSSNSTIDPNSKEKYGYNSLVNYGRFISNRFPQALYMCLNTVELDGNEESETQQEMFFYPSDVGEILLFESLTGQLVSKYIRPVPPGVAKYGTIPRTTCIATRKEMMPVASKEAIEYFSGALDGTITRWYIPEDNSQSNSLKDDKNEFLEEAAKSTECQRDESSSDSDSENDYEFVGNVL